VIHFLVFNVGDFLGRYICAFPRLLIWSANWLLTLSLARTLFILLFLMCNIQAAIVRSPNASHHQLRHSLHASPLRVWVVERLCLELGHDVGTIFGAQSPIERPKG
ncbi:hypothetical protein FPV67DRAFT_1501422, partial [Lyophyllum atratum]